MSVVLQNEAESKFPTYTSGGRKDELAWAKRFKYRYERGDKAVKKFQYDAAVEALENAGMKGTQNDNEPA